MSRKQTIGAIAAQAVEACSESSNHCYNAAAELRQNSRASSDQRRAEQSVESSIKFVGTTADAACAQIEGCGDLAKAYFRDYREKREDHGLKYDAAIKNVLHACLIILIFFLAEGTTAGSMMIMDGKMGIISGFTYGFAFAAINIAIGLFCGFYCTRYSFSQLPEHPAPEDFLFQRVAKSGLVICIIFLILLIFSAARTRVLGTHTGIFTFAEIGVFETFNDGMALAIIALGILGSCAAILEGARGLSDFQPNYTAMRLQAEQVPQERAKTCRNNSVDDIENRYDDTVEDYEITLEDIQTERDNSGQDQSELRGKCLNHNKLIINKRNEVNQAIDREAAIEDCSREQIANSLDLSVFDQFHIPVEDFENHFQPLALEILPSDVLNRLDQAQDDALTRIQAAYSEFQIAAARAARASYVPQPLSHNGDYAHG